LEKFKDLFSLKASKKQSKDDQIRKLETFQESSDLGENTLLKNAQQKESPGVTRRKFKGSNQDGKEERNAKLAKVKAIKISKVKINQPQRRPQQTQNLNSSNSSLRMGYVLG